MNTYIKILVLILTSCLLGVSSTTVYAKKGGNGGGGRGGGGNKTPGSECSGGVHVCNIQDAYAKCGVSKHKGQRTWNPDDPARNVVCCCHSDTCPETCNEEVLTNTGEIDAAMAAAESGDTFLLDRLNGIIEACNIRGHLGGIDMVPKCARVDSETGEPICPSGGATDLLPGGEHIETVDGVLAPRVGINFNDEYNPMNEFGERDDYCTGENPWCKTDQYSSCVDTDSDGIPECLCDEDVLPASR